MLVLETSTDRLAAPDLPLCVHMSQPGILPLRTATCCVPGPANSQVCGAADKLAYMSAGRNFLTKINANIGNSAVTSSIEEVGIGRLCSSLYAPHRSWPSSACCVPVSFQGCQRAGAQQQAHGLELQGQAISRGLAGLAMLADAG